MRGSVLLTATIFSLLATLITACEKHGPPSSSQQIILVHHESGLRTAVDTDRGARYLKVLPRRAPSAASWIEIECPERVWGRREGEKQAVELLPRTGGSNNETGESGPVPAWRLEGESLVLETKLGGGINVTARAQAESDGLRFSYQITNTSDAGYDFIQPVTRVGLYSVLSDVYLERTYVRHEGGFELLASGMKSRLGMTPEEWLPCRYLARCTSESPAGGLPADLDDGSVWYFFTGEIDAPFIATVSTAQRTVVATYSSQAEYVWIDAEQTSQHSDPFVSLGPGETATITLKTFIFDGTLDQLWEKIRSERQGTDSGDGNQMESSTE